MKDFSALPTVCFHIMNSIFQSYLSCLFCPDFKGKGHILPDGNGRGSQSEVVNIYTTGICNPKDSQHILVTLFQKCSASMFYDPIGILIFPIPIHCSLYHKVRMGFGDIVQIIGHAFADIKRGVFFQLF